MTFEEAMVNVGEAIQALEATNAALRKEVERLKNEVIDSKHDIVALNCARRDTDTGVTRLDSCANSTNAEAMRFLAKEGLVIIEKEIGRRVIGKWAE